MRISQVIYILSLLIGALVFSCRQKEEALRPEVDLSAVKNIFVASGGSVFEIVNPNSSPESIQRYSGNAFIKTLRVDIAQEKLYWIDTDGNLKRIDTDGTNEETLAVIPGLTSFVLDIKNNFAYCVDNTDILYRVNLLNQGVLMQFKVAGNPFLRAIDLDEINNRLYFCDSKIGKIVSTDLVGGNVISTPIDAQATHIVLDEVKGKIYWFDTNAKRFMFAPVDGSEPASVSFDISFATYFSVDPTSNNIYYGLGGDFIVRNIDGTGPVKILRSFDFLLNGNVLVFN